MPQYSGDAAGVLQLAVRGEFNAAYARRRPQAIANMIATMLTGTSKTIPFGWLGNVPTMTRKVGEYQRKQLRDNKFSITDSVWSDVIAFSREMVEDQQFDAAMPRVRDLALEAVRAIDRAVIKDVLCNGTTVLCYDGQPLFSANHNEGKSGNQNNLYNLAFNAANLKTVIQNMGAIVDDQGEPMGIQPDTITFGPGIEFDVMQILNSSLIVNGGTTDRGNANTLQNYLKPVKASYLIGPYANYWFVSDNSREIRGTIVYERSDVPTEVTVKAAPEDDNMFYDDEIHAKVRKRFEAAPGLWQTVSGSFI